MLLLLEVENDSKSKCKVVVGDIIGAGLNRLWLFLCHFLN